MQAAKEKLSNMASSAKEHVDVSKANAEEKAEKASARNEGEKEIAHEERKAKEAEAEMNLHSSKAEHKEEREGGVTRVPLVGVRGHGARHPVGNVGSSTGTAEGDHHP